MSDLGRLVLLPMLLSIVVLSESKDMDKEMTVKINPGVVDCFYENLSGNDIIDLEFQVINAGQGGEMTVDFYIYNSGGNVLKSEYGVADGIHRLTISETGDYKFCWDNSRSRFSSKTIFFALFIESNEDSTESSYYEQFAVTSPSVIYEMKVEDIKDAIDRIRSYLTKSRFMQDAISAGEAKDRNLAENNYSRINFFSLLAIFVMMATGTVQVVLLRSLFDEKSKFHKLWKNGSTPNY